MRVEVNLQVSEPTPSISRLHAPWPRRQLDSLEQLDGMHRAAHEVVRASCQGFDRATVAGPLAEYNEVSLTQPPAQGLDIADCLVVDPRNREQRGIGSKGQSLFQPGNRRHGNWLVAPPLRD